MGDPRMMRGSNDAWDYSRLSWALVISLILQAIFLPCLCDVGTAKLRLALVVDAMIIARAGVSFLARESGSGWKFYTWLLYTSPLWISVLAWAVTGDL
jgi:hypothetical protein